MTNKKLENIASRKFEKMILAPGLPSLASKKPGKFETVQFENNLLFSYTKMI